MEGGIKEARTGSEEGEVSSDSDSDSEGGL